MSAGHVYVLINPAFPGLVKVGCTGGSPEERARQLSAVTSVPQPYLVAYSAHVNNMEEVERRVHAVLGSRGVRVTPNREFFQATPTEAVDALLAVVRHLESEPGASAPQPSPDIREEAERLTQAAWRARVGEGRYTPACSH